MATVDRTLPIRLSPTATSGSVRPCSWTFTSVAIFGSHNRSQSSSDFFPTTRPAPPTWRRLAGATGLFAPIVSRGVSANHPSRLRKPENVAERHPSRGQSPAPASLPQRIHLPFQQAVLSVQRLPFPARHRGRRHRTLPTQSFTPEPGSILHVGGVGNNRIGKDRTWTALSGGRAGSIIALPDVIVPEDPKVNYLVSGRDTHDVRTVGQTAHSGPRVAFLLILAFELGGIAVKFRVVPGFGLFPDISLGLLNEPRRLLWDYAYRVIFLMCLPSVNDIKA